MTEHHPFHQISREVDVPLDVLVHQHAALARKLQAEAMAASLAAVWHGLVRAARTSAGWLREQRRRAATRRALMACSDRTLADIGIAREHIHLAARGVDVSDLTAVNDAGLWSRLVAAVRRTNERQRRRSQIYRELTAYSDRDLEEIGLHRSDIPAIARAA